MEFSWAQNYPEVHKVCINFSLTELKDPIKYSYTPLPGFLQEGPQCGLVALAIYLGNPSPDSVTNLFTTAKENAFTNNGEMFSALNMAKLATQLLGASKVHLHCGILNCNEIKEMLLNGTNILVPYDTAKDNSPGLLNGCKAHWGIICGAVETENDFFVIARHGKARNVAIWKLSDLSDSNAQLNEVGSYLKQPEIVFNVPEGGIDGPLGLKCKCVLLKS